MPHHDLNSPAIIIRNASLRFDHKIIFKNLNCTIAAKTFTCILGPSGVGKSSLLQLLANIIDLDTAQLTADISTSSGISLMNNIAYMAQTDLLLPWLSVLNNALLGSRLRGKVSAAKKQRAITLLTHVGLADELDQRPDKLSGGMRQRVALVRTLLEDKPIILMDEPFSALDAITRLQLQDLAATLLQDKTVLLVTHDPLEALRLGHEVYVMSGTPATLGEAICPAGKIPRATNNETILKLQGELLTRLEAAQCQTTIKIAQNTLITSSPHSHEGGA